MSSLPALRRAQRPLKLPRGVLHQLDCRAFLDLLPDECVDLIYVDPPFNSKKKQTRRTTRARRVDDAFCDAEQAAYEGFGGHRYARVEEGRIGYEDKREDYIAWLRGSMEESHRVLREHGAIFLHLDRREAHYAKVMLDEVFGRDCFQNEIIWAYDFGGRSRRAWPAKHDTIFWYSKHPRHYTFNFDAIDRIPYMAPSLVGKEKAQRGKIPTDVWWQTIVATNGREKTGYPNQKPLVLIDRIVRVHSREDDLVVDFFAGSGTTGEAAARNDRRFLLNDNHPEAVRVMRNRLKPYL